MTYFWGTTKVRRSKKACGRIHVPEELVRQAAVEGWKTSRLALEAHVSHFTALDLLVEMRGKLGLPQRSRKLRPKGGRVGVKEKSRSEENSVSFSDAEDGRIRSFEKRNLFAEKVKLLSLAYSGDQSALLELWQRYRLRLPLVEARLINEKTCQEKNAPSEKNP